MTMSFGSLFSNPFTAAAGTAHSDPFHHAEAAATGADAAHQLAPGRVPELPGGIGAALGGIGLAGNVDKIAHGQAGEGGLGLASNLTSIAGGLAETAPKALGPLGLGLGFLARGNEGGQYTNSIAQAFQNGEHQNTALSPNPGLGGLPGGVGHFFNGVNSAASAAVTNAPSTLARGVAGTASDIWNTPLGGTGGPGGQFGPHISLGSIASTAASGLESAGKWGVGALNTAGNAIANNPVTNAAGDVVNGVANFFGGL
jgi:hypothetical protein